ncbi:MAG: DNA integrity scanning protein DisA nucleotide-binding domain protein [Elusimicrobia bacterium]|nr:DNA integrity scanning protein DisA nucleotide-binding domain protein [Elusimicrobiota bacterium]
MNLPPIKKVDPTDVADMLMVGVFVYGTLIWFKRAKTAFVAMGLLVLAAVYVFARAAGLYLTTWILQGFFAVLIIAIIVIFQEEIRAMFERLAVWSLSGRRQDEVHPKVVTMIVRSVGDFARDRIGALIVLKGKDPLDRHTEGGWELNGELSEALLESIFDSHSLGHDGAVLIEEGRVTKFGVHLPLSKEFGKIAHLGTRHTAALGLSELSDALCIVVSEEKGTISIARGGELRKAADLKSLEGVLEGFFRSRSPRTAQDHLRNFFSRNMAEKAIAAAVAVLLWVIFVGLG